MRKVVETIFCDYCQSPIQEFKIISVPQLQGDKIINIEKEVCDICCNKIISFFNNPNNFITADNHIQTPEKIINDAPTITEENNLRTNKNLFIPPVNIQIPVLNKEPNFPLPSKWPDTKIFLSGIGHAKERAINRKFKIPYILDSIIDFPIQPSKLVRQYFDYIKTNNIEYMMDSSAFTYLSNPKKKLDLDNLIQKYCYYINEFDIKNFFELDLDIFLSIEEIENIRRKIYLETHKSPIVVFHEQRGFDYWIKMCKENNIIAYGGIVSASMFSSEHYKQFNEFCDIAHSYNTKVHGLGYTSLSILNAHTMCFDTVDSTGWNFGRRGHAAKINEKGELIKAPLSNDFLLTTEQQENDLKAWATFSSNYKGTIRLEDK